MDFGIGILSEPKAVEVWQIPPERWTSESNENGLGLSSGDVSSALLDEREHPGHAGAMLIKVVPQNKSVLGFGQGLFYFT